MNTDDYRGVATGWSGVVMFTPSLSGVVPDANRASFYGGRGYASSEFDMEWIHPWVGLNWAGLGQDFQGTLWIGLDLVG